MSEKIERSRVHLGLQATGLEVVELRADMRYPWRTGVEMRTNRQRRHTKKPPPRATEETRPEAVTVTVQ